MYYLNRCYFIQFILLTSVTCIDSIPSVCDTFECDSDKCLPFSSVCDGTSDCLDGTDEGLHCRTATVECVAKHEYLCDDGQCILSTLRCDGSTDCLDGSDEARCDVDYEQPFCKEFTCDNGERCISLKYLCDGHQECADGTDESGLHCSILSSDCSGTDEFLCRNGHCLPAMFRCDGSSDCEDNSDELGCHIGIRPNDCTDTGGFLCGNGHCLPAMFRCDGATDCFDKSDEQGCQTDNPNGSTDKPLTSLGPQVKASPTTNVATKSILTTISNEKTPKPTTSDPIISAKTSPTSASNDVETKRTTHKLFTTRMPSSRAAVTDFNVIDNRKPITKRTGNGVNDVGTFHSKRGAHHMRNIYGGTAIFLTLGTIGVILLIAVHRRIRTPPKTAAAVLMKNNAVHFINPFYGSG